MTAGIPAYFYRSIVVKKYISALIFVVLIFAGQAGLAEGPGAAGKLTIDNNSRMDMVELYPSTLNSGAWGQEQLKGKTLGYGDRVEIDIDPGLKMVDLRAVFANGTERTYYGINVQKYSRVRLDTMDMEPFE